MQFSTSSDLLRAAREHAGLSLREAARRGGTSHATLRAYERGEKHPSLNTLSRLLNAMGFTMSVKLHPRVREANGLSRDEELRQVLALAEQFPAARQSALLFPRFSNDCCNSL